MDIGVVGIILKMGKEKIVNGSNLKFKTEDGNTHPVQEVLEYLVIKHNTNYLARAETTNLFDSFFNFPVIKKLEDLNDDYWLVRKEEVLETETPYQYFKRVYSREEESLSSMKFWDAVRVKYLITSKIIPVNVETILDHRK